MDFVIEELLMNAWPSIQTVVYDGWIIRLSNGYTKRANSINPIYPSKIDLGEKIQYCRELYTKHNLPTVYKLVECDEHKIIDRKPEALKYEKVDMTSVQICDNIGISEKNHAGINVSADFNERWINGFVECNNIETGFINTKRINGERDTGSRRAYRRLYPRQGRRCPPNPRANYRSFGT
jgi:hypothetical protein